MNNCGVVRDLLPLYADGVCSEQSSDLVEKHIAECEKCSEELETYFYETADEERKYGEKAAVINFKRKVERRAMKKIILSFVLVCLVAFGVWNGVWYFTAKAPYNDYQKRYEKNVVYENGEFINKFNMGTLSDIQFTVRQPQYLENNGVIYVYAPKHDKITVSIEVRPQEKENERYLLCFMTDEGESDYLGCFFIDENLNSLYTDEEIEKDIASLKKVNTTESESSLRERFQAHRETENELLKEYNNTVKSLMDATKEVFFS